jgi:uncharacterized protein (TIGR03032 family)
MKAVRPKDQSHAMKIRCAEAWRDPWEVVSLAQNSAGIDPKLFRGRVRGAWWDILQALGVTLFVTREYEHFIQALTVSAGKPGTSFFPLPHPSGMVYDPAGGMLYIASTRNPNQIFAFKPAAALLDRQDIQSETAEAGLKDKPLMPVASRFLPGCTYVHDLAMIQGVLHANAVGHNSVIRMDADGGCRRVWWPRCIEKNNVPDFSRNYLQLNSIAAGAGLDSSFFTASTAAVSSRRPGHKNFAVDKQGVLFSGKTREPVIAGLTRPHSARLHHNRIWLNNSGYGELGLIEGDRYVPWAGLPGWTRGLLLIDTYAFVGTSRVLSRFRQYAPGLDVDASVCGIHAIDLQTGKIIGSICWPYGSQIFSIEAVAATLTCGFITKTHRRSRRQIRDVYYRYQIKGDFENEK